MTEWETLSERCVKLQNALAEAEKRLNVAWIMGHHNRELRFMLKLAKGGIEQAIVSEDGLDGSDGEALIKMIDGKLGMRLVEGEEKARAQTAVCDAVKKMWDQLDEGTGELKESADDVALHNAIDEALLKLKAVEDKGDEYEVGLIDRMDTDALRQKYIADMTSAVQDLLGHGHNYGYASLACIRKDCKGCAAESKLEGMIE